MLGILHADQGDRGRLELGVQGPRDAHDGLQLALGSIATHARQADLRLTPRPIRLESGPVAMAPAAQHLQEHFIQARPDASFTVAVEGHLEPYKVPASQAEELRALLRLRDTAVNILRPEGRSLI